MSQIIEIGPMRIKNLGTPWGGEWFVDRRGRLLCLKSMREYFSIPKHPKASSTWFLQVSITRPDHRRYLRVRRAAGTDVEVRINGRWEFEETSTSMDILMRRLFRRGMEYYVWLEEEYDA